MRICVLGNSHVGALKLAWDRIKNKCESFELIFFARGGQAMQDLVESNGLLVPKTERLRKTIEFTSGGYSLVNPRDFDIFLLYGLSFSVSPFLPSEFYSSQVKCATRVDRFERSIASSLFYSLRTLTENRIFIAHSPLPAEQHSKCKSQLDISLYYEEICWYEDYLQSAATILPQPEITISRGQFTRADYSKCSLKLETGDSDDNEPHPDTDTKHMNSEFGEVWLQSLFKVV